MTENQHTTAQEPAAHKTCTCCTICTNGCRKENLFPLEDICTGAAFVNRLCQNLKRTTEALQESRRLRDAERVQKEKDLAEYKKLADLYKTDRDAFEAENIELRKAASIEECTQMHFRLSMIHKVMEQLKSDKTRLEIENRNLKAALANLGAMNHETKTE